jgi:hypothetical protein
VVLLRDVHLQNHPVHLQWWHTSERPHAQSASWIDVAVCIVLCWRSEKV